MISITCNINQMKSVLTTFRAIEEEVLFMFYPDKLKLWMMDKSTSEVLEMNADKSAFLNYTCDAEKSVLIGVDSILGKLARTMEDDTLLINLAEKSNEVKFHIIKREQKKITGNREFSAPILEQTVPYKDFTRKSANSFKITSALWKTAILDMNVGDKGEKGNFSFAITKDRLKFLSSEVGKIKSKVEYHKSRLREITLTEESVNCEYSLFYAFGFFRSIPDDLLLEFHVTSGKPLICRFEMSDIKLGAFENTQPFKFMYLLAPIVSRDENKPKDEDDGGLQLGSEMEVPALDKKEDDKGLEV